MEVKRGRPALPEDMRAKTTSIRLRPDRLELFKKFGGIKWLNKLIDSRREVHETT